MAHFEARFDDNAIYVQTANDESVSVAGKNSFYDVLNNPHKLVDFAIVVDEGTRYSVNLTNGQFAVNGVPFQVVGQDQNYVPEEPKLVYFKEMHQNFVAGEESPYETKINRYLLGWEDENQKSIIAIKGENNG